MAEPLPEPEGDEYIRVGRSSVHDRGLFAARDLPKGTFIVEYRGEKVTRGEGNRRAHAQWAKGRIYVFRLNQRYDIDGAQAGNKARLANHSCDPNAETQNERGRRIWLVAMQDIRKGEELTFDYHLEFQDPPPECRCGSNECIGYMVGPDGYRELREWMKANGVEVPRRLRRLPRPAE